MDINIFHKLFLNIYLIKTIFKHVRELNGVIVDHKQYTLDFYSYQQWVCVDDDRIPSILKNKHIGLLIDKLGHSIHSQYIKFGSAEAVAVCKHVDDYNQFLAIYNLKQDTFISDDLIPAACKLGNIDIVKHLIQQTHPLILKLNYEDAFKVAIQYNHLHLADFIVTHHHTHKNNQNNNNHPIESISFDYLLRNYNPRDANQKWIDLWLNDRSPNHRLMRMKFRDDNNNQQQVKTEELITEDECLEIMIKKFKPCLHHLLDLGQPDLYFKFKNQFSKLQYGYFIHNCIEKLEKFPIDKRIDLIITIILNNNSNDESFQNYNSIDAYLYGTVIKDMVRRYPHITESIMRDRTTYNEHIYLLLLSKPKTYWNGLPRLIELEIGLTTKFPETLPNTIKFLVGNLDVPLELIYPHLKLPELLSISHMYDEPCSYLNQEEFIHMLRTILKQSDPAMVEVASYLLDRYLSLYPEIRNRFPTINGELFECGSANSLYFLIERMSKTGNNGIKVTYDSLLHLINRPDIFEKLKEICSGDKLFDIFYFAMFNSLMLSTHSNGQFFILLSYLSSISTTGDLETDEPYYSRNFYQFKSIVSKFTNHARLVDFDSIRLGISGSVEIYEMFKECFNNGWIIIAENSNWESTVLHYAISFDRFDLIQSIKQHSPDIFKNWMYNINYNFYNNQSLLFYLDHITNDKSLQSTSSDIEALDFIIVNCSSNQFEILVQYNNQSLLERIKTIFKTKDIWKSIDHNNNFELLYTLIKFNIIIHVNISLKNKLQQNQQSNNILKLALEKNIINFTNDKLEPVLLWTQYKVLNNKK